MITRVAKFGIGQVVKHRIYPFRGVIFDVDPVFANTEEWWRHIPAEVRPAKDQPFYHLFAENAETQYVAYVSEQNLTARRLRRAGARQSANRRNVRARRRRRLSNAHDAPLELDRFQSTVISNFDRLPPVPATGQCARRGDKDRSIGFGYLGGCAARRLSRGLGALLFELLALQAGLLLKLLLQFLILLLEHLRINRRTVECGGEILHRQNEVHLDIALIAHLDGRRLRLLQGGDGRAVELCFGKQPFGKQIANSPAIGSPLSMIKRKPGLIISATGSRKRATRFSSPCIW